MSDKKPVIVYGASGYTGRLICEFLRELNVPFIAAGRDAARVRRLSKKYPVSSPQIMKWRKLSTRRLR